MIILHISDSNDVITCLDCLYNNMKNVVDFCILFSVNQKIDMGNVRMIQRRKSEYLCGIHELKVKNKLALASLPQWLECQPAD